MADEQITSSTANIPYVNFINVGSDQAAPSAGRAILYIKSGVAYVRLDTGDPVPVGGVVALAEGQLAVGDGSGILSALALGDEGDVVTADANGMATWATPAPGGTSDYTLIGSHVVPAGDETSVEFSAIAGTYRDLELVLSVRCARTNGVQAAIVQFNTDTGNHYGWQRVSGVSTTAAAADEGGSAVGGIIIGNAPGTNTGAGPALNARLLIPNYAGTLYHKVLMGQSHWRTTTNPQAASIYSLAGHWNNTAAITTITFTCNAAEKYKEGSLFALYGIG